MSAKEVQLLKELMPNLKRFAMIWETSNAGAVLQSQEIQEAARNLGLQTLPFTVSNLADIEKAFDVAARRRTQAMIIMHTPLTVSVRTKLAELALNRKMALFSAPTDFADAGALMSYGTSLASYFPRAALLVDKILKGAKPADIPVEQPTKFELVINMKTAKALGLQIPQAMLFRADRVIE